MKDHQSVVLDTLKERVKAWSRGIPSGHPLVPLANLLDEVLHELERYDAEVKRSHTAALEYADAADAATQKSAEQQREIERLNRLLDALELATDDTGYCGSCKSFTEILRRNRNA